VAQLHGEDGAVDAGQGRGSAAAGVVDGSALALLTRTRSGDEVDAGATGHEHGVVVVAQTDIGVAVAVTTVGMDAVSTARWRLADDGVAGSGLGAARARSSCSASRRVPGVEGEGARRLGAARSRARTRQGSTSRSARL